MITAASIKSPAALQECTMRELGELARKVGVDNWRSMRKDQLIRTLVRAATQRSQPASKNKTKTPAGKAPMAKTPAAKAPAVKAPAVKAPAVKAPAVKTPAVKTPAAKGSAAKSPAGKSPAAKSPAASARRPSSPPARPAVNAQRAQPTRSQPTAKSPSRATRVAKAPLKAAPKTSPRVTRRIQALNEQREHRMDLSQTLNGHGDAAPTNGRSTDRDRIVLLVRDSYWLQACWDLTRHSVERARAALAENWHTAKPVLRVFDVDNGPTTSTSERMLRDIEIHGGVRNWYIDVEGPSRSFRVEIGYACANDKFYSLARSNTVTTPAPGAAEGLDGHWTDVAENYERIYALSGGYAEEHATGELQEMFEERLRRPMGAPAASRYGVGAERLLNRNRGFDFEVDAEMIIFGRTKPDAHVTLTGEPVKLREDGSFAVRLGLPDRRQVLPIVASSADGVEQRTIVLAVERNTKVMEPVIHEAND